MVYRTVDAKKLLAVLCTLIIGFGLISSCSQTPAEPETEPAVTEVQATEQPTSTATTVDYTDLFPEYPTEVPSHCDPDKVQAAYEWAEENFTIPLEENEGYIPRVRPAKERYKIGVIQGLVGIPAQARGDVSVQNVADLMCVDLVWCDSKYDGEAAITCAESMVQQEVDGVINENWFDPSMDAMADIMEGIPATTWEVPMREIFFGTEHCTDGRLKGEWFVEYTKANYEGDIADIWIAPNVNYDVGDAMQRITCAVDVIKEAFPEIPEDQYVELPGGSFTDQAFEAMTTWLTAHPDAQWVFGTGINDNGAVGAATACDSAGFADRCVILGSNGEAQAWNELDKPNDESSFKGTIDHTQIDDGRYMVPIVVDKIEGMNVPDQIYQYIFVLDRDNMAEHTATRPQD
jgi:ABC-type sugar transport system substrate-binding protein